MTLCRIRDHCVDRSGSAALFAHYSATIDIYTLSLHDALPIFVGSRVFVGSNDGRLYELDLATGTKKWEFDTGAAVEFPFFRSEEHTSELQSRVDIVCRLLLEKKKRERSATGIAAITMRSVLAS